MSENRHFYCSECGKAYAYYKNLRKHVSVAHPAKMEVVAPLIRSEKYAFHCHICNKNFSDERDLGHHQRSSHDVSVQSDSPIFWSREATLALLSAYEMQKERLGKDFRYKNYMWVAISDALKNELGKNFTPAQCENRFRVLVRSYRRGMDKNLKALRRKKDFEYQAQMQRILKGEKRLGLKLLPLLSATDVTTNGEKSNVQVGDVCSEPESVPVSKELSINSGKSNVNSDVISGQPEPATSSSKQLFLIRGKTNVTSDGISSEAQPSPNSSKNLFLITATPNVNSDGICKPNESESSRPSSKQLFIITGKPTVKSDRLGGEPEPAPGSNKQLFIISGKPSVSNDRITSESQPTPSSGKQLFIISGKPSVNNNTINNEPENTPNSGKQLFIVGGKSNVNSDKISSVPESTPVSNEPEQAASSSRQSFINQSRSPVSPPEKRKKLKQVFLEQIRADRKLYYEKKLEVDRERLQGLERRNDELLELKKMKLTQTERLIACEEEKIKCEKEKINISREKLKMYGKLVELQEENNEILRSINDHLDFLL